MSPFSSRCNDSWRHLRFGVLRQADCHVQRAAIVVEIWLSCCFTDSRIALASFASFTRQNAEEVKVESVTARRLDREDLQTSMNLGVNYSQDKAMTQVHEVLSK